MFKQIKIALTLFMLFSILTGLIYPILITGIAQLLFPWQANGSLIAKNDKTIGSLLIGQPFSDPKYFWGRPSATSPLPYNAANSSGSNKGPSNENFLAEVKLRVLALKKFDPQNPSPLIPIDLVTTSGSGLDPEISPLAALYQIHRIAKTRGIPEEELEILVKNFTKHRVFGILGEPRINILQLNLALDNLARNRYERASPQP